MAAFVGLREVIFAFAQKDFFFTLLHSDMLFACIRHSAKAMRMCTWRGLNARAFLFARCVDLH
jgi:hypothetical protein